MLFPALIVPAFCLFAALEFLIAQKRKRDRHTFENSTANITIGIAERLLNLFIAGAFYDLYSYIYKEYSLFHVSSAWYVWLALLLVTDFVWYWYHRLGHEINIMWAAHIVHHQSEEFNYTVSARITTFQAVIRNAFWCVLPFFGFDPAMVITILVIHGAYSFFTHTEVVDKLGWLEKILVTPSHHRVHHASNEEYLNKNYGDIFIFWDKLFGTFQEEKRTPVYGLTHPLRRHSFLWQHFHYFAELFEACRRSGSIWKSIGIIFGRPEAVDQTIREDLEHTLLPERSFPKISIQFKLYVIAQILISLIVLAVFTLNFTAYSAAEKTLVVFILLITLINCGAMLEQQRWIYYLEIARLMLTVTLVSIELESITLFGISVICILAISPNQSIQRGYFQLLYKNASSNC